MQSELSFLQRVSTGAATKFLTLGILREMGLRIPPIETQRTITSLLSAYDDLIDNNLRRIKILEEMAQSLYKEWFVDFRFPGHENVTMVDSPLGMIPEGWEASSPGSRAISSWGNLLHPTFTTLRARACLSIKVSPTLATIFPRTVSSAMDQVGWQSPVTFWLALGHRSVG